jgi:electron transport complex protein RnfE
MVLGGMRELIGQGTLFADMNLLLGPMASDWVIRPFEHYPNMLFMVLPPGAFIGLGLLIALKNSIDNQLAKRTRVAEPKAAPSVSKRVRVTGTIS